MTSNDGLFPGLEPDQAGEDTRSHDKKRRDRQRARQDEAIRRGFHPLSVALGVNLPLHNDRSRTCGTCRYRAHKGGFARAYPVCAFEDTPGRHTRNTNGPGTDVKKSWPACRDHQPKENQ